MRRLGDEGIRAYWQLHRELKAGAADMDSAVVSAWAAAEALSQLNSIEETARAAAEAADVAEEEDTPGIAAARATLARASAKRAAMAAAARQAKAARRSREEAVQRARADEEAAAAEARRQIERWRERADNDASSNGTARFSAGSDRYHAGARGSIGLAQSHTGVPGKGAARSETGACGKKESMKVGSARWSKWKERSYRRAQFLVQQARIAAQPGGGGAGNGGALEP
ncbi:hypothetical protein V8E36_002351 [Tilletia maclaganii]